MKSSSAMFSFMTLCVAQIIDVDIKQNISHAWLLGSHTLGKLIFLVIYLNVKQNLGYT